MNLNELTIKQSADGLKKKQFSSVDLTKFCLDRIKKVDGQVKAYITVTDKLALAQAKVFDDRLAAGEKLSPLAGIPVCVKDVLVTQGIRSTAASNILKNYVGAYDATSIKKLKDDGAVILGKVNCDSFAQGASTENSDFFPSHNPWDLERVPGGSSGGSSAAVAADMAIYSIGSDTGGSIRQPASFCGRVGLKPTYGRVSRYGLMAMTSSTDCVSPLTKTVRDAATVLNSIAGHDSKDGTSSSEKTIDYVKGLSKDLPKKLKVGIPDEYFAEGTDPAVAKALREAIDLLIGMGADVHNITLPHTKDSLPVYYIITPSEISANLARYDGIRYGASVPGKTLNEVYTKTRHEGFGDEVKRRIMLGTYTLSSGYYDAFYLKAAKVRTLVKEDFLKAFQEVDVIITPTSPHPAFKLGAQDEDPLAMYLEDIYLSAVSLAGLPAISVPCGMIKPKDGKVEMPIGMQIVGKHFDEATILKVAHVYEQSTEWHLNKPKL